MRGTDRKSKGMSRRDFLGSTAAVGAFTIVDRHVLGGVGQIPPSEKLNIAGIGFGGRGYGDLRSVPDENIVALCDVDWRLGGVKEAFDFWPKARRWKDYRKMLDEQKDIDAVIVATPDHTHAVITMAAIKAGKHVYCEKPLTHTVYEAREIAKAAREAGVATQLGNQGQADESARVLYELIHDGAIGNVREIHGWSNRYPRISPRGIARPADKPAVPDGLDWDLWLGPARERPYHPAYLPFSWRGWWDFGTGVLGDIGCHNFSAIYKALDLGAPVSAEASSTNYQCPDEIKNETAPLGSVVHFEFAAKGDRPAVSLTWYDGGMMPIRPKELEADRQMGGGDGMLYVGDKGAILGHRLIPEKKMQEYGTPPKLLERSVGHHAEWVRACKGGKAAGSNFDHAGPLTEMVLLGNIAIRTGKKLYWDPDAFKITNDADANKYLHYEYRGGWSL
jgi:predicted dehydrogenase